MVQQPAEYRGDLIVWLGIYCFEASHGDLRGPTIQAKAATTTHEYVCTLVGVHFF